MSKRDCGKWYCQKAPGCRELELGVDVLIWPGTPAADDDRKDLDRERAQINLWFEDTREKVGNAVWLAGPGHGGGSANFYWVWDPDSRDRYFEYTIARPGELRQDFGDLHRGLAWQFPMLAVFTGQPMHRDLIPLMRNKVPYVVVNPVPEPDPRPDPDEDSAVDEMLATFDEEYAYASTNTKRLGVLFEMLHYLIRVSD